MNTGRRSFRRRRWRPLVGGMQPCADDTVVSTYRPTPGEVICPPLGLPPVPPPAVFPPHPPWEWEETVVIPERPCSSRSIPVSSTGSTPLAETRPVFSRDSRPFDGRVLPVSRGIDRKRRTSTRNKHFMY